MWKFLKKPKSVSEPLIPQIETKEEIIYYAPLYDINEGTMNLIKKFESDIEEMHNRHQNNCFNKGKLIINSG